MGKTRNYAGELKKYARRTQSELKYVDVGSDMGPDQEERFSKRAVVNGELFPIGVGNTEKKAKQNAAKNALRILSEKENQRPAKKKCKSANENAAKKPTQVNQVSLHHEHGQKNKMAPRAVEPHNAALCCSFVVGNEDHPATTRKAKRKANQEGAKPRNPEICGSKTTELMPATCSKKVGAGAIKDCESCVMLKKTPVWDMQKEQHPVVKPERRLDTCFQDACKISSKDEMIAEVACTGNSEMTSAQSKTSRFVEDFDSIECLGKGAFGQVYKAREKLTGKFFAIKIVPFKENRKALREVKALSELQHRNIVRFFTCWLDVCGHQWDSESDSCSTSQSSITDPSLKYLYIQLELCCTVTLRLWIDEKNVKSKLRDSERSEESLTIVKQTVSGVEYIHSMNLIHRDLKPANIMFGPNGEVKIGDFGLVTAEKDDDAENLLVRTLDKGTPSYMAPEQKNRLNYDRKVDIYSVALIYFEILWKFSTSHERVEIWADVRNQKFPQGFSLRFSQEYMIIKDMLSGNPEDRPEASEVNKRLEEVSRRNDMQEIVRRGSRSV